MAKDYNRTQRVGDQIKRELAMLIQREIKDPRLSMITVTDVEVTKDFSLATVYVTVLTYDEEKQDVIKENLFILNNAGSFLRNALNKVIKLRVIPKLLFKYDSSIDTGSKMSELIEYALDQDKKLASKTGD